MFIMSTADKADANHPEAPIEAQSWKVSKRQSVNKIPRDTEVQRAMPACPG